MSPPPPEGALVLGSYKLGSRLGVGSMGSVFRAVDVRSGQDVVVKFFDGQEDGFSPWASELRLVMRLKHNSIIACLDTGFDQGRGLLVLVLQQAKGGSLRRALVSGRRFTTQQTLQLLVSIGAALAYAHAQGVVHRDVKPENILAQSTAKDSQWLLTDFGAGRFLPRGEVARSIAGSIGYMAPEVLHQAATAASDQYSLGVLGVELLLGQPPSQQERASLLESLARRAGLPGILGRLLKSDPQQRFKDMDQVVTALQRELSDMKYDGDINALLRPYLEKNHDLSADALLRLEQEWDGHSNYLDFLVGKNLLPRTTARTIEAIRKGYVDVSIESVLGISIQSETAIAAPVLRPAQPAPVQAPTTMPAAAPAGLAPTKPRGQSPAAVPRPRSTKPAVGMYLGRYVLQERLGEGVSATVFRSFHEVLSIPVAIKVFEPIDVGADLEAPQRFRQEAQTLVRLEHPNIVRVLDADIDEQLPYIVMEYVGETTLENLIHNFGRLPELRIAQIGLAVAAALEAAWRVGLLHRDVKPSNILERKDGQIKLVDFGIASKRKPDGGPSDSQETPGLVFGTPAYLAPEQVLSPDQIDFRADMYALGATLYHAAVGRPTFSRGTVHDTIMAQINEEPTPISVIEPGFAGHLAATIHRMLKTQPQDRFASWAEVKAALADTVILLQQPEISITSPKASPVLDPKTAELPPVARQPESIPPAAAPDPANPASRPAPHPPAVARLAPAPALLRPTPAGPPSTLSRLVILSQPLRTRWQELPENLQTAGLVGLALLFLWVLFVVLFGRGG